MHDRTLDLTAEEAAAVRYLWRGPADAPFPRPEVLETLVAKGCVHKRVMQDEPWGRVLRPELTELGVQLARPMP